MVRILILYHSVHTKSPNYGMFGSLFIPKNKKLGSVASNVMKNFIFLYLQQKDVQKSLFS